MDGNGEFIIFEEPSQDKEKVEETSPLDLQVEKENKLEDNFSKLNYVNKINILMKALMIERNKNAEKQIREEVVFREYTDRVKTLAMLQNENDELIEKVANMEIEQEQ